MMMSFLRISGPVHKTFFQLHRERLVLLLSPEANEEIIRMRQRWSSKHTKSRPAALTFHTILSYFYLGSA